MDDLQISITRISQKLELTGYVIDSDQLENLDAACKETIKYEHGETGATTTYWIKKSDKEGLEFDDYSSFNDYLSSNPIKIDSISMKYLSFPGTGLSLLFQPRGEIEVSGYSNLPDFQFNIDRIINDIEGSYDDYNWPVRNFIFNRRIKNAMTTILMGLSIMLFLSIGYLFYARSVGVNIDPSLIPSGNTYFQQLEEVLNSGDTNDKLDILLVAQLRNFSNVEEIIIRQERFISILVFSIIVLLIIYICLRLISNLYPRSFFAVGKNVQVLADMKRKREIWGVAIIIGFIVNVVAGLLIAILME